MYESALAKALFHLSMSEGLIVPEKWGAAAGEATTAAAAADTMVLTCAKISGRSIYR